MVLGLLTLRELTYRRPAVRAYLPVLMDLARSALISDVQA